MFRADGLQHRWASIVRVGMLALVGLTAACGAVAEPVLPTVRPTYTPSLEPSATATRIFNATPTPTRAQAATTPTEGPSPTPLMGPIPTQSPLTITPTQGLVLGNLEIEYFTTNASSLRPGDKLTLFWSTKGVEKATIYRLDAKGKRQQLWNVARAGSIEVATKAEDRDVVQFLLTIGDATNHLDQTLAVPLSCSEPWFFEPQPSACAPSPAIVSAEVEQTFERGVMVWVQAQTRIYVLFNDNQKPLWAYYPDEFKDGQPDRDPGLSPPAGLFQPIRGFGLVWRTREKVRERLGWATGAEFPFDGMLQGDGTVEGGVMYIRDKSGNILELSDKGVSWKLITP